MFFFLRVALIILQLNVGTAARLQDRRDTKTKLRCNLLVTYKTDVSSRDFSKLTFVRELWHGKDIKSLPILTTV